MKLNLPHFLFINGPAGSGKSTLAELICSSHPHAYRESFAEPIRQMIYSVFFPEDGPIDYQHNLRDQKVKDSLLPVLAKTHTLEEVSDIDHPCQAVTVREAMICFSEQFMKLRFGSDIFGRLLFNRCCLQTAFYSSFIIDDSGFNEEASYVISRVGPDNCHLIRLHRRERSFSGDSRNYISLPGVQTLDLHNNSTPQAMMDTLAAELGQPDKPEAIPNLGAL